MADNTNSVGVDLTQTPDDFKNIALGKKEVEVKTSEEKVKPSKESAAETSPLPKEGAPQDNVGKTTDEKRLDEEKNPVEKTPNDGKKMTPDEFRRLEAARMIQRQGEERKRAMLAHIEAVRLNPDHVHTVAKVDKKLANEVVKEVWGYRDYDELVAQTKIAEIKESDPERAELELRLLRLEQDAKNSAENAKKQIAEAFFASKGFTPTEFDPRYVKTMEKLALLNPSFVASDYRGALAEAYRMATGEEIVDPSKERIQEALNQSAVMPSGSIKQPHSPSTGYGEAAENFAKTVGVKLT